MTNIKCEAKKSVDKILFKLKKKEFLFAKNQKKEKKKRNAILRKKYGRRSN